MSPAVLPPGGAGGPEDNECGFSDIADMDGDGIKEIIIAKHREAKAEMYRPTVSDDGKVTFTMTTAEPATWSGTGQTKALAVADINGDGKMNIVCASTPSVYWMKYDKHYTEPKRTVHRIFEKGQKLDNVVMADVDGDGDMDVLTTDERGQKYQLIWLENPLNPTTPVIGRHGAHPAHLAPTGSVSNVAVPLKVFESGGDKRVGRDSETRLRTGGLAGSHISKATGIQSQTASTGHSE